MTVLKCFFTGSLLALSIVMVGAQSLERLGLAEAYGLLEQRYPTLGDTALIRQMEVAELELNERQRLPGIQLRADGRLQSTSTQLQTDNTMLDFEINQPLVNVKAYLEANYLLVDGGHQDIRQSLIQLEKAVEQGELEVQRFALRKIVNQLFLRIHSLQAQRELFVISLATLEARMEQLQAAITQGAVLESERTRLEVKQLELEAQQDNLDFQIKGARQTLADWLGVDLSEYLVLQFPDFATISLNGEIQRPELELFEQQKAVVLAQAEMIDIQLKPKVNLFAQAGVGYPNPLNILDNNVAPYGIIGAGMTWTIRDWDKTKKQKALLSLQAQRIDHAAATFSFRLERQRAAYLTDIARLNQQITQQERIIDLQKELLAQAAVQLEQGIITTTDYLLQVNAELASRQKIAVLQAEKMAVQLSYWNERGAF